GTFPQRIFNPGLIGVLQPNSLLTLIALIFNLIPCYALLHEQLRKCVARATSPCHCYQRADYRLGIGACQYARALCRPETRAAACSSHFERRAAQKGKETVQCCGPSATFRNGQGKVEEGESCGQEHIIGLTRIAWPASPLSRLKGIALGSKNRLVPAAL